MKVKPFGLVFVALALVLFVSAPAFSAEQATQQAVPAASDEKPATPASQPVPPPPPKAEDTTGPASEPADQSSIKIEDTVVCQDVVDRAPVGSGDVFAKETAKIYCFTRVVGASGESQITHNWYYKGTLKSSVKLTVRSNNWRTWSSKTMMPEWTGEWMVEVLSEDGTPLESIIFFLQ